MQLKLWRHLYHLSLGLLLAFLYYLTSQKIMLIGLFIATLICVLIEYIRLRIRSLNRWLITRFSTLLKPEEERHVTGQTYFLLGCLLTVLFFEKEIAIISLLFLAVGDVASVMTNTFSGRIKLFGKSLEGTIGCLIVCLCVGLILHFSLLKIEIWIIFVGASTAAFSELLSIPPDDNLTVPLCVGATTSLCGFF